MKKILFTLFIFGILCSCSSDDNSNSSIELIGDWKLKEVLADPGDGSGTFTSVESSKIITFKNNGIISSNGNFCDMSISSDNQTSGTYSNSELTFNSSDCYDPAYDYTF